jgi:hypothetical protein
MLWETDASKICAARSRKAFGLTFHSWSIWVDLARVFIDEAKTYPFVQEARAMVLEQPSREETDFHPTLRKGECEIRRLIENGPVTGHAAFQIFETFGYPLELTEQVMAENGVKIIERKGLFCASSWPRGPTSAMPRTPCETMSPSDERPPQKNPRLENTGRCHG